MLNIILKYNINKVNKLLFKLYTELDGLCDVTNLIDIYNNDSILFRDRFTLAI